MISGPIKNKHVIQVSIIPRLYRFFLRFEESLLVIILLCTITFAVTQILLRNFLHAGIPWGDSLVRILVLWLGLIGAMIASRNHRHIKIDILSRHLNPVNQTRLRRFTDVITSAVCFIVAWYAFSFVMIEYQDGMTAFESVPVWVTQIIIPYAFFTMAVRYLLSALLPHSIQSD
jgi:TRAP-type C4-dicarboxylate transport system permease small subunit